MVYFRPLRIVLSVSVLSIFSITLCPINLFFGFKIFGEFSRIHMTSSQTLIRHLEVILRLFPETIILRLSQIRGNDTMVSPSPLANIIRFCHLPANAAGLRIPLQCSIGFVRLIRKRDQRPAHWLREMG